MLSRREVLFRIGGGFGALGLASLLADPASATSVNPLSPRPPHFTPRAKRIIFLFMNGGPSHVDTFDPKPMLARLAGKPVPDSVAKAVNRNRGGKLMPSPLKLKKHGKSGIEVAQM